MKQYKVSIIVPCYNAEKWIDQCIESIFSQTYKNIEVIAVDNESKDDTFIKLNYLKLKYPSLIIDTAPNIYKHSWDEPRQKGLELSSGDYITIICADDFLEKNYIELCMNYILSAPKVIKAFQSPIRGIKDDTIVNYQTHTYKNIAELKQKLLSGCCINTPTVIYNRELYNNKLLTTKPDLYLGAADYDMYCNLTHNDIMIYPSPKWLGYNYRWHPEQATWGMHKEPISYDKLIQEYWRKKWNNV